MTVTTGRRVRGPVRRGWDRAETWLLRERHASLQVAACRIGTALSVLGLLATNFPTRQMWAGQASIWAQPVRDATSFPELALLDGVSPGVLTIVYVVTMVAAALLMVGWHTKAANAVTLIGFIAIVGQNPVLGDEGDNLIRLTLLWLLLMRTAERWSLDARPTRLRDGSGHAWQEDVLPEWLATSLHNVALVALAAQTMLAYTSAGLDKVAESVWQHGTALYSTMQLPEYRPFPWLSDLLSSSEIVLAVLTYAVLIVQLFFVPFLLNPVSRRILLVVAIATTAIFAVLFAAPWSSLAVIAVTSLFLPETTLERVGDRITRLATPVIDRVDDVTYGAFLRVRDFWQLTILRRR